MKTLLMAIDKSASMASKVTDLTLQQALAHQAEVVVVCCMPMDDENQNSQPIEIDAADTRDIDRHVFSQDVQNSAEQIVRFALAPLLSAGVPAKGLVCCGDPAKNIVQQAQKHSADMIIMGRRHLSSLNRWFKGSVSAAVLEQAPCPVLIDTLAEN